MTEKNKIHILEMIKVSSFLAFVISFMIFMWLSKVEDVQLLKIHITIWVVGWVIMLIFGFSKGSIIGFAFSLAKILFDKELGAEAKIGILMGMIQDALDVTAYLSMMVQDEKGKEEHISIEEVIEEVKKEIPPIV